MDRKSLEVIRETARQRPWLAALYVVVPLLTAAGGWLGASSFSFSFAHGGKPDHGHEEGTGGEPAFAPTYKRPEKPSDSDPVVLTYGEWRELQAAQKRLAERFTHEMRYRLGERVARDRISRMCLKQAERDSVGASVQRVRENYDGYVLSGDSAEEAVRKVLERERISP